MSIERAALIDAEMRTDVRLPDGFPISGGWIHSSWLSPFPARNVAYKLGRERGKRHEIA